MNKNKRVAIITLYYNSCNYGGILQAYALSKTVEKFLYKCDVLKIQNKSVPVDYFSSLKKSLKVYGLRKTLRKCIARTYNIFYDRLVIKQIYKLTGIEKRILQRKQAFKLFRETKIPHCGKVFDENNIVEISDKYDIFICGSDQIWNMGWNILNPVIYWLDFVPSSKIKISYAASIGINFFTDEQEQKAKKYLSGFSSVSVREKQAKELLGKLLNGSNSKEVHWTLDPTLLFTAGEWDKVCAPRRIKEKYIFAYILGDSAAQRKFIKKFAEAGKLTVVTLPYLHSAFRFCDLNFGDIKLYDVSPEDFISLIKHAESVFTDSFHGTVFSGIYHKEFFLFRRNKDTDKNSMNSRIYSLTELFGTEHRIIDENSGTDITDIIKNIQPIDYEILDKNIETKREYSLTFLKNALLSAPKIKEEKVK